MATLEEFFSHYGTVRAVVLRYKNRDDCALVSFVDTAAAEAVVKSPQAILDNRFVRVRPFAPRDVTDVMPLHRACAGVDVRSGQSRSHAAGDIDVEAGATHSAGEKSDDGGHYREEKRRDAAAEGTHERAAGRNRPRPRRNQ